MMGNSACGPPGIPGPTLEKKVPFCFPFVIKIGDTGKGCSSNRSNEICRDLTKTVRPKNDPSNFSISKDIN